MTPGKSIPSDPGSIKSLGSDISGGNQLIYKQFVIFKFLNISLQLPYIQNTSLILCFFQSSTVTYCKQISKDQCILPLVFPTFSFPLSLAFRLGPFFLFHMRSIFISEFPFSFPFASSFHSHSPFLFSFLFFFCIFFSFLLFFCLL